MRCEQNGYYNFAIFIMVLSIYLFNTLIFLSGGDTIVLIGFY